MIEELELQNFRSHKFTKLNFTEGNNIHVGISGSGKSSVLDAICLAFFGIIPKVQKKKIKLSDLIMNKPYKNEKSKIKLNFKLNNKTYEVIREIYLDSPTHAELRENNKLIAVGQNQVTNAIEYILKINYDLFSKVIYSEQNQIDYFLNLPPGNRMNNIDELLKLDKFGILRAKAISYANKFKSLEISKKETISTFNEKELKDKRKNLEEEIENLKKEKEIIEKELNNNEKKLEEVESNFIKLKDKKEKYEKLSEKLGQISTLINLFETELRGVELKDLKILENKLKIKEENLDKVEKGNLEIERKTSFLTSKINELKKNFEEKKQAETFLKTYNPRILNNLEKEKEKLSKLILEKKVTKNNLEEAIEKLKITKEKCPVCDSLLPTEKREKLIETKLKEASLINVELLNLSNLVKEINLKIEKETKNFEKAKFYERRIKQLTNVEKQLEEINRNLEEIKNKKIDTRNLKKEIEKLKEEFKKTKELTEKKEKLKNYREQEVELKKELKKIEFDENLLENIRNEIDILREKKISLSKELEFKQEIIKEKKNFLNQILKDIKFIEINKEEIKFLSYASNTLNNLANILVEIQETLRQEFVRTLNEVMNEIWNDIYPYEDYIGIRFKIEEKDYLLQLCDLKNKWVNVEGFSSGGERAIASLVMRLALSIVLAPKLKILILDEPTHNLDTNTIQKFIEILRTKISNLIEQVFIVTHDERLIQAGTGYIYEFLREASKKEPTTYRKLDIY